MGEREGERDREREREKSGEESYPLSRDCKSVMFVGVWTIYPSAWHTVRPR